MDDFSIQHTRNGNVTVVTISGRVDSVTAATLDDELLKIVDENKKLVLDLKHVVYLSSAGVRAIIRAAQSAQRSEGGVKLARIPDMVTEVLENVGLMQVLKSYPSVDLAVASF
jgi:anti-sigma B factor antagonist